MDLYSAGDHHHVLWADHPSQIAVEARGNTQYRSAISVSAPNISTQAPNSARRRLIPVSSRAQDGTEHHAVKHAHTMSTSAHINPPPDPVSLDTSDPYSKSSDEETAHRSTPQSTSTVERQALLLYEFNLRTLCRSVHLKGPSRQPRAICCMSIPVQSMCLKQKKLLFSVLHLDSKAPCAWPEDI